jgi:hypothetical protein
MHSWRSYEPWDWHPDQEADGIILWLVTLNGKSFECIKYEPYDQYNGPKPHQGYRPYAVVWPDQPGKIVWHSAVPAKSPPDAIKHAVAASKYCAAVSGLPGYPDLIAEAWEIERATRESWASLANMPITRGWQYPQVFEWPTPPS